MALPAVIVVAISTATQLPCVAGLSHVRCAEAIEVAGARVESVIRPIASSTMQAEELVVAGPGVADWITFAQQSVGTAVGQSRVFVDGVEAPAASIAPHLIARINVNTDPFAAEFAGVDELRIDIDSRPPDRRWRFHTALPSLVAGGRSLVASAAGADTRSLSGGLSGPVARTPLTFSIAATAFEERRPAVFAFAENGVVATSTEPIHTTNTTMTAALGATWSAPRLLIRGGWTMNDTRVANAGVGGIHSASLAQSLRTHGQRGDTSWRIAQGRILHRGAISISRDRLDTRGSASGPNRVITGQSISGGVDVLESEQHATRWHLKHVVESPSARRPWKGGVEAEHSAVSESRRSNPFGRVQLASLNSATGTLTLTPPASSERAVVTGAAAFAEQLIVARRGTVVRAGARADWQDGDGLLLSPRLSVGTAISRVTLSAGAGLVVQPTMPHLLANARLRDGLVLVQGDAVEPLHSGVAPSFRRRRHGVLRTGLGGRVGRVLLGAERTWTFGMALAGSVRVRTARGLVDTLDSDRSLRRTQTHARATVPWRRHSLTVRYEHVTSRDDTDGAFSLPAIQADVAAEWGPSAVVPVHTATLLASLQLPRAWRVVITADARAGSRFNIITGADEEGLGTFTSRGGRPRNAGVLPASRTLSVYAAKLVRVKPLRNLPLNVGMRVDNLTNRTNVLSVGRVVGSPLFGVPLAAQPGRSLRLWATLAR